MVLGWEKKKMPSTKRYQAPSEKTLEESGSSSYISQSYLSQASGRQLYCPRPPVVPSFRRWDWGGCQKGPVIPNLRRYDWRCRASFQQSGRCLPTRSWCASVLAYIDTVEYTPAYKDIRSIGLPNRLWYTPALVETLD